jgi:hypothetical protein
MIELISLPYLQYTYSKTHSYMKCAICPFLLFLLLTNGVSPAYGQVKIAKAVYRCESLVQKAKEGYNGTNTLYFTAEKSLYIHNDYQKAD